MLDKRRRDRDRPKRIRSEELRNGKSLEKNKWDESVHLHPDGSLICRGKWVCGIQGSACVYLYIRNSPSLPDYPSCCSEIFPTSCLLI